MDIRRGEIYYIMRGESCGSEQESGRPAIVVSNEHNNRYSEMAEVVYLTTQPKKDMPTHVIIEATGQTSTALCEQIHTVSSERIGDWRATCSEDEMKAVDAALLVSLGIPIEKVPSDDETYTAHLLGEINKKESELKVYKSLYNELLEKLVKK